jgi:protein-tyrosine-phosphatase
MWVRIVGKEREIQKFKICFLPVPPGIKPNYKMKNKIYILFVCNDNALYSQMAEAMVKLYRDDEILAFSAGLEPARKLSPKAVELMERIGYQDMSQHDTKSIDDVPEFNYDFVITIGVPAYVQVAANKRLEWRFSEIDEVDDVQLLRLRDKLLNKVLNLVIPLNPVVAERPMSESGFTGLRD